MSWSRTNEGSGMTRRAFLRRGGALALKGGSLIGGLADVQAHAHPDDKPYRLLHIDAMGTRHVGYTHYLKNLPREADGLLILHVTDIHGGADGVTRIGPQSMRELAWSINMVAQTLCRVDVDMRVLALTGDYVNHAGDKILKISETRQADFKKVLTGIDLIQAGHRLAVRGNHDNEVTWGDQLPQILIDHGYSMNTHCGRERTIKGLRFIGRRDFVSDMLFDKGTYYGDPRRRSEMSEELDTPDPKVVLTHSACALDPDVTGVKFANMIALTGHVHDCQFPKDGFFMRGLRRAAQYRMRQLGYRGDIWETQSVKQTGRHRDVGTSVIHVGHGVGDHPEHVATRMSTHTVGYIQLRQAPR